MEREGRSKRGSYEVIERQEKMTSLYWLTSTRRKERGRNTFSNLFLLT